MCLMQALVVRKAPIEVDGQHPPPLCEREVLNRVHDLNARV